MCAYCSEKQNITRDAFFVVNGEETGTIFLSHGSKERNLHSLIYIASFIKRASGFRKSLTRQFRVGLSQVRLEFGDSKMASSHMTPF